MGAQNCCLKPEVKKTELEGGQVSGEIVDIDKDAYPHDSEQIYRAEGNNKAEFEAQNQVSNQEIYNKEAQSPQLGNTYEVAVSANNQNNIENEEKENNQNIQNIQSPNKINSEENNNAEQENNSPKPEDGNVMEAQQVEEKETNKIEQGEEEAEEQVEVEEQVEEEGEGEGEGEEGQEEAEQGGEQEEEKNDNASDPLLGATVNDTNYIVDNNNYNFQQNSEPEQYEYINGQIYKVIGNNSANETNSYVNNYESGAFISAENSNNAYDTNNLNNIQVLQPSSGNENVDLNQYFQQGVSGNFELNNYSVNPNVDFNNLGFSTSVPQANYYQSVNLESNNLVTQNTGTFDLNNINLGQANDNNIEVSQYNVGVSPQSGNAVASSYNMQGMTMSNIGEATYAIPATTNSAITFSGEQAAFGINNNIESSYQQAQA